MATETDSDSDSAQEDRESDNETVNDEEKERIRNELSTMSFEDLQKLKQTLGAKVYNETVFGRSNIKKQTTFKRANKNRPREMSSKRPIKITNELITGAKPTVARDPRFDPLCGSFDEKQFRANYGFINDLKRNEVKQLQRELKKTGDPKRQKEIKLLIQRLENQIREQEKREKKQKKMDVERDEIREKLQRGEKPIFKRKSERKIEELVEKYEELKKTNKLQKHLERRSKKMARKEFKKMPKQSVQ